VFKITFPDNNIADMDCKVVGCDDIQAVAAGYFVHVPPLSKGLHTIHFAGSIFLKTLLFGLDIMYKLAIAKN
jgi:hypothetical protein